MRSPFNFNFNQVTSFFDNKLREASDVFSVLTSNLMQQQNPSQPTKPPSAQESMAGQAVAASLAKRSSVSKPPQPSTSAQSTSSAPANNAGVARFGLAAQVPAQTTSAPARPAQITAQTTSAPAQNQNISDITATGVKNLISLFNKFAPSEAQTQAQPAPTRVAPARVAPASTRLAPAPARAEPAPAPARPAQNKVPNISPQLQARTFYQNELTSKINALDFNKLKNGGVIPARRHLQEKMALWGKQLSDQGQINQSLVTISTNDSKKEMLEKYTSFLKENIQKTRSLYEKEGKDMQLALLTAQELEMAKMRFFCGACKDLGSDKSKIFNSLTPETQIYATRRNEKKLASSSFGNEDFINSIEVPTPLIYTNLNVGELDILTREVGKLYRESKQAPSRTTSMPTTQSAPSPSPSLATQISIKKTSPEKEERKALRVAINSKNFHQISQPFERPLIIGEGTLAERKSQIEQLFGGNGQSSNNASNSSTEGPKSKENSLIGYVDFLSKKIELVKKTISSKKTNDDQKFKLQCLQGEISKEIVKIREGVFPQRKMSDAEKRTEAQNLIQYISSDKIKNSINMNNVISSAKNIDHGSNQSGDRIIYSPSTLNSLDGKIKSIVSLVNPLEKQLEKTVRSGSGQGRDPGKTWAGIQIPDARGPSRGGGR